MFQSHLNLECIPEIKVLRPGAHDNIMICDTAGFADGVGDDESLQRKFRDGDLSCVAQSDKFLDEIEKNIILSRAWNVRNDVVGSLPNIPQYIAGQPASMRRRRRLRQPKGPLAIFLETTGSSNVVTSSAIRGCAMLALVRLLSNQRPVELWITTTFGTTNEMNGLICRIDTQPLDLARAAFQLTHLNYTAIYGCDRIQTVLRRRPGSWAYGTPDLERKYCGQIFGRFLCPGSEVLYVPAAFGGDSTVHNPTKWVRDMLVKYGGEPVERGEDETEADENETGYVEGAR